MSAVVLWVIVASGLLMLISRRRSVCIVLVAIQSLLIGVAALVAAPARSSAFATAAVILVVKAVGITFFMALAVRRTHERTRVQADLDPLARLAITLVGVVLFELLLPPLPFLTSQQQQGTIALLGLGFAMVLTRRATLLQLLGILMCENAVALAAVCAPGGIPVIIELGAAADVIVFCSVGLAFHQRIFAVLGTGDSANMRELRD
ncbi:MAG: hypothetical protein WCI74_14175 [Actinomycetes bacterium]